MSKLNRRHNFITRLAQTPQEDFKGLFDAAPVPLVEGTWGASFKVLSSNTAVRDLFAAATPEQFNTGFNSLLLKIPGKVLLELLSARVKGDQFEAEVRLPTLSKGQVYVLIRMAYMPQSSQGSQHVLLAFQDITATKRRENFLKRLSQIDGLTQVFNHRAILERLDEEMFRARRYRLDLSCIIFDLDHLKQIGDKCIKQAVQVFKSCVRKTDIIGRYGEAGFLVILPETKPEQAIVPIQRFLKLYKDKSFKASFSMGVAGFPSKGIESVRDLVKAADQALYLSKTSGGDSYRLYAQDGS